MMDIQEIESILYDLDAMVELARKHCNTPRFLEIVHSAIEIRRIVEKQIPKPPVEKVHPKHKKLGKMHYCECGVLFYGWGNPEEETNYCGNCGQKLREGK